MVLDRLSHTAGSVLRVYGRGVYPWAKLATAPVIKRLFDVKVEHEDRVPRFGPAIICPNHLSFIDPFFVALVMTRRITYIARMQLFNAMACDLLNLTLGLIEQLLLRRPHVRQYLLEINSGQT